MADQVSNTWARVVEDSISPMGVRLTTLELNYPYIVHAELMTHRVFSRNAASMRAIPTPKIIEQVRTNPFIPSQWPIEQKGMQPAGFFSPDDPIVQTLRSNWLVAAGQACATASLLHELGVHKQIATRPMAPFSYIRTIVTATEWENWDNLRTHSDAQFEMWEMANCVENARLASKPKRLGYDVWHLPYVQPEEREALDPEDQIKISVARCARVSYLTHDGRVDVNRDLTLYDRLLSSGHMSPMEHAARPWHSDGFIGNFRGWLQHRKTLRGESVWKGPSSESSTRSRG